MPSHSFRFIYFNVRGAGELCRLALVAGNFDWNDVRYPMSLSQSGFVPGDEFLRDAKLYACNMNHLPVLQIIDKERNLSVATIGQSHAIVRFVARQHATMMGENEIDAAKIDSIYECCRDIQSAWYKAKANGNKKEWLSVDLPQMCELLEFAIQSLREKSLPNDNDDTKSKKGWVLGGTDFTLADVAIYHLLSSSTSLTTGGNVSFMDNEDVSKAYENCPSISRSIKAFGELRSIQQWLKERPDAFS